MANARYAVPRLLQDGYCDVPCVQANPGVPVVDNLEDIWRVSKLQRERKAKEEAAKKARLVKMRVRIPKEGTRQSKSSKTFVSQAFAKGMGYSTLGIKAYY